MISERDVNPRTAAQLRIRAALLTPHAEETPLPVVSRTQELDPGDILEVRDMAEVIARAEQIVTAPRSSRPVSRADTTDIFDALVRRPSASVAGAFLRMPTDDAIGPATPAPHATISTLPPPPAVAQPVAIPLPPIAASSLVLTVPSAIEDDAFYTPGGRVRSLADVTLDGYRPEPTLLVRARARRKGLSWLAVGVLLPILGIAAIAFFGRQETATAATTSTTTLATATIPAAKPAVTAQPAAAIPTPKPVAITSKQAPRAGVPTFDVNSLPTAKAKP